MVLGTAAPNQRREGGTIAEECSAAHVEKHAGIAGHELYRCRKA